MTDASYFYAVYQEAIELCVYLIIEGYHRQLRKVTKTKTAYPTDDALKKIIYLATVEAAKKWTMPVRDWKNCISQLAIYFGDRIESEMAI